MRIRLLLYILLSFPILLLSCQKGDRPATRPEVVVQQYQDYIDNNRFEAARRISTAEEGRRLNQLAADMAKETDEAILNTRFLSIDCEEKNGIALCLCDLQDQYEEYSLVYKLVRSGNSWLMDAPNKRGGGAEAQIVQELLEELYD